MMQYLKEQKHDTSDHTLSSILESHDFTTDISVLPYQPGISPGFDHDLFNWYSYLYIRDFIYIYILHEK